jgi:VanZ family protein
MQHDALLGGRTTWGCITALFTLQIVGALIVQRLFKLNFNEVIIPVSLLVLGTLVSLGFWSYAGADKLGSWKWWVPVIFYAAFIFSLSNRSYSGATPCFSTKIFHPIEYAVLGLLLCVAWLSGSAGKDLSSLAARVFSLGILYGASDELHQAFIPGRSPRVVDLIFWDLLGITLGLVAFLLIRRIWKSSDI